MINVLVVDDSAVARSLITHVLDADMDIRVAGVAASGAEAIEAVKRSRPDVITMDITMPHMDGLEATRQIMETLPTPIVIVSSLVDGKDMDITFRAIDAGALAVLGLPYGIGHPDHARSSAELVRTVKLMSEVKVVRRWARLRATATTTVLNTNKLATEPLEESAGAGVQVAGREPERALAPGVAQPTNVKLVAIGGSTGAPPVVRNILAALPDNFPVPVVIVQHMAAGFTQGFAEWLSSTTSRQVVVPRDGERLLPGKTYVAPEGKHIGIGPGNVVSLRVAPPEHGMRPAVSYLFRSVVDSLGPNALGVLLTGMGKDGAAELKLMRDRGAVTVAQDAESSVVHGMPGEAIRLGGATYVRPGDKIGPLVSRLVGAPIDGATL